MATLDISTRGRRLFAYQIVTPRVTIGRGDAQVSLPSLQLSRCHCVIEQERGEYRLTDLSTNGTRINGRRLPRERPHTVRHDDLIEAGPYQIRLLVEPRRPARAVRTRELDDLGDALIGRSPQMRRIARMVLRLAESRCTVLITGESGTGKGVVARAVHQLSGAGPFEALNVAAVPAGLFEAELFGHEKGAFTDAVARRDGAFHRAHTGTLFLDEIGELPLDAQAKLLCVLEDLEVRRVGGGEIERLEVRVIAATNRDLGRMGAAGTFREDLMHRLTCVQLELPPLRERRDDIPLLARALLERAHPGMTVSDEALTHLTRRRWPGNVRGLRHALDRAVFFAEGDTIEPRHLTRRAPRDVPDRETVFEALHHFEGERPAADSLGLSRSALKRLMERYDIAPLPRHTGRRAD